VGILNYEFSFVLFLPARIFICALTNNKRHR